MGTVSELAKGLQEGVFSARELTEQLLAAGEKAQTELNLYITTTPERALATADRVDQLRKQGAKLPPLAGIPMAIKDNLATAGVATTCGSRLLKDYVPQFNATVVDRLGLCPLLGKTNMDEFAMGSSTGTSAFGPTANPWDSTRVPGGSSGGSAAAVAAGCAPFALGSDTGGSVRQPASFCGVTGLKPTWGRVSRRGLVAFASSLDQVGILARTAADCAYVLQGIAGVDALDATSAPEPVPDYVGSLEQGIEGLTIGWLRDPHSEDQPGVTRAMEQAAAQLEQTGARLVELDMPYGRQALAAYHVIAPAEASSNLARFDGVRYGFRGKGVDYASVVACSRQFGQEVRLRLLAGTFMLSGENQQDYYTAALKARRLITGFFLSLFDQVDLLFSPATPLVAFRWGERENPLPMYFNDYHAIPSSLAGLPAIALPCGHANGLPVGMQLVAPAFGEALLLRAGHAWQQMTDWHLLQPGEVK